HHVHFVPRRTTVVEEVTAAEVFEGGLQRSVVVGVELIDDRELLGGQAGESGAERLDRAAEVGGERTVCPGLGELGQGGVDVAEGSVGGEHLRGWVEQEVVVVGEPEVARHLVGGGSPTATTAAVTGLATAFRCYLVERGQGVGVERGGEAVRQDVVQLGGDLLRLVHEGSQQAHGGRGVAPECVSGAERVEG